MRIILERNKNKEWGMLQNYDKGKDCLVNNRCYTQKNSS